MFIAAFLLSVVSLTLANPVSAAEPRFILEIHNRTQADLLIEAETVDCWQADEGQRMTHIEGGRIMTLKTGPSDSLICSLSDGWVTFRAVDDKHGTRFGEIKIENGDTPDCHSERRKWANEDQRGFMRHLKQECTMRGRRAVWHINPH